MCPPTFCGKRVLTNKLDGCSCTWPIRHGQIDRMVREIISCVQQRVPQTRYFYNLNSVVIRHARFSNVLLVELVLLVQNQDSLPAKSGLSLGKIKILLLRSQDSPFARSSFLICRIKTNSTYKLLASACAPAGIFPARKHVLGISGTCHF